MGCTNVTDVLIREQGRVSGDLFQRSFNRSPWMRLVRRGVFPDGMGHTLSVVTYERTAPTTAQPQWSQVHINDVGTGLTATFNATAGGSCTPDYDTISVGQTIRTYSLCRRVIHGPDFCVENIRFSFQLREQLEAVMDVLTEYIIQEWDIRDRHEYLRLVKWKVTVANNTSEETDTGCTMDPSDYWGATCPTGLLTQGLLNRWRIRLLRDGAAGSALGVENGNPVLTLICSAETSEDLIFRNADIRQDLRWGDPPALLKPFGVTRSYRGFYHLIDMYPIRGHCAGGVFTEVAAFASAAASKGNKSDVNAVWEGAYYEISFIFDPMVFLQMIPRPITRPADKFRFDPVNYMGDWQIKNILDRTCNPDGTILFHRGILAAGSKPEKPERGVAFLHLRCDPALNLVTNCS